MNPSLKAPFNVVLGSLDETTNPYFILLAFFVGEPSPFTKIAFVLEQ
jgi:hypothetical protein